MNKVGTFDHIVFVRSNGGQIVHGFSVELSVDWCLIGGIIDLGSSRYSDGPRCFLFVFQSHSCKDIFSTVGSSSSAHVDVNGGTSVSWSKGWIVRHVRLLMLGFDKVIGGAVNHPRAVHTNAHVNGRRRCRYNRIPKTTHRNGKKAIGKVGRRCQEKVETDYLQHYPSQTAQTSCHREICFTRDPLLINHFGSFGYWIVHQSTSVHRTAMGQTEGTGVVIQSYTEETIFDPTEWPSGAFLLDILRENQQLESLKDSNGQLSPH
jgi:hypothetical protein